MPTPRRFIVFASFSVVFILFMHYIVWRAVSSSSSQRGQYSSSTSENLHNHFSHVRSSPGVGSGARGTCRDVFEIGKNSTHMSEFMNMAVTLIKNKKVSRRFMLNVFYEVTGYSSPRMVRTLNDSSGVAGSNISLAQVGLYLLPTLFNEVGMRMVNVIEFVLYVSLT